jgi:tRNA A37 methylthiotransferase MiaB
VVEEVSKLVKQGFYDFSFISQDSSSYLRDLGINNGLERLIDEIENLDGVKSARILYLYPSTTTINLIKKITNSKIFHNYFDMPLQHINNDILHLMKRGKGANKIIELLNFMKKAPNPFIRTTFIVGYPQESEDNFNQLCKFVEEFKFSRANVFGYSDEEGTSSYNANGKISQEIIDKRATILGKIISKNTKKDLKNDIGKIYKVVVDGASSEHDYLLSARKLLWAPQIDGEIYINENLTNNDLEIGKIYTAKITQLAGDKLLATVIK